MAKNKKGSRNSFSPDDVIAERIRPDARELVALIHEVNPTGLGLDRKETARRYALKSRLQSSLVRRFPESIDAMPNPNEPGIVALRYVSLDLDACHALLAELDDDARSRVQHIIDTRDDEERASNRPAERISSRNHDRDDPTPQGAADVQTLLDEGAAALEAYDYELARQQFEAALDQSHGGRDAARALLSLLVEQLGADEEALAVQDKLGDTALSDGTVRSLLAIAAARHGERARALDLIEERGVKRQPSHIADVFVALAKNALAIGNLTQASSDLARAMEFIGTHPEFASLLDALTKARIAARGPEEAEIANLFAKGHVRDAEERATELLSRFPESEVARRVKRAIDEQKRRNEANVRLDEARVALESGDETRASSLLRSALSMGLSADDAAWAEARIAAIENAELVRTEEARIAETLRILHSNDLAQGLSSYADLSNTSRRQVTGRFASPLLSWMDDLCPFRGGGKSGSAIAAILALHRATELVSSDPASALERVSVHEKTLHGFAPAEEVRKAAHIALAEQQRRIAQNRMEAARRAFVEGETHLGARIANDILEKHLSAEETLVLNELRRQIQSVIERKALEATLEQHRRQNDPVSALGIAQRLEARSEGVAAERIASVCAELRAETRRAFSVRVELGKDATTPEWNCLQDARIVPKWKWETMLPDPRGGPDDFLLVIPQTRSEWVFIRVIDVKSGEVRARVSLRTPTQIDMIHPAIRNRHLFMVGRFGAFLEIDLDDWSVLQWSPNFLRNGDLAPRTEIEHAILEMTLPRTIIDGVAISPDSRYLWANTFYDRHSSDDRRIIHILEIDGLKPHRDMRAQSGDRIVCQAVVGLDRPCMAIVNEDEERTLQKTSFYDPRGWPWEDWSIPVAMTPKTLVACPDGKHIFGSTSDPDGPKDPYTVAWGFYEMRAGCSTPLRVLPDVSGIYHAVAATSLETRMCFLLFWSQSKCELFGFSAGVESPEVAYRLLVPRYSALVTTPDGRHAALLVIHEGRPEIVRLGATPPKFENAESLPPFLLPCLPRGSLHAKHFDCDQPTGAFSTTVSAAENELRRLGKSRYRERIRRAKKKGDPNELVALDYALQRLNESELAGQLSAYLDKNFPNHARVRLSYSRTLAAVERWHDVRACLENIDPRSLSESDAKHFHHMRGIALMMLDEPEVALAEFDRGMSYKEGSCEIEELIALCAPLSDTERSWSNESRVTRDWLGRIQEADAALERGDATAARRAVDVQIVWEANDVQSFGRLAEAYLREGAQGIEGDRFRKTLALVGFCELADARNTMTRREVPLPRATWGDERLTDIARKARQWLDDAFGGKLEVG